MSPLTMAWSCAGGRDRAVAADVDDDHLAAVEHARRAGLGHPVEGERCAGGHRAADDHPVVVGVDQPDLAALRRCRRRGSGGGASSVSKPRAVAGSMAWRVSTVSMGLRQRKSSRRGVKVSMRTPGSPRARQRMRGARGDDEGVAGADGEGLAADGELEVAGLHEGRLHVRVAVRRADAVGGEGELDEHQLRVLGEHAALHVVAGVDDGEGADVVGHGRSFQWNSDGSQSDSAGT